MTTLKTMQAVLLCIGLFIGVPCDADECRDLAHAKRAHVFVIEDSAGPVYGYAELVDVMTAWRAPKTNWTETIQGKSVSEVRARLAKLMRDEVIRNPRPPRIVRDALFGTEWFEWGDIDDGRKSIYNVDKWATRRASQRGNAHGRYRRVGTSRPMNV